MKKRIVKIVCLTLLMSGLSVCHNLIASTPHFASKSILKSHSVKVSKKSAVIDINTASVSSLTSLKGIGLKRAKAIVAYRDAHGVFDSVQDLSKVKGISAASLKNLLKHNPDKIVANPKS